jgi:hypothetical protein
MSSAVDISNQALVMLGASPIVSFEDKTIEANALKVVYGPAKEQILRSYPWRCAMKTATLAQLEDAPISPDWAFAWAWPEDAIRIVRIFEGQYPHNEWPEWEVRGRHIYTKRAGVIAEYVYDVPEPYLDAHVEMALAAKIAVDLSYTLTASNAREQGLNSLFQLKIQEARTTDRQEASHKRFYIDKLSRVR